MLEHADPIDRLRVHADIGLDVDRHPAIVDSVRRRLEAAGGAASRAPRRRRRPRWKTLIPAGIATIAVAGGTAAATGVWNPSLGDDQRGHPTEATTDIPADQLQRFGVLRRDATPEDRDAVTASALRYLDSRLQGVHVNRIRAVETGGTRYLVVPVERDYSGAQDALCLFTPGGVGRLLACWTTQQVLDGDAVLNGLAQGRPPGRRDLTRPETLRPGAAEATAVGLVPDGVAEVTTAGGARASVTDNVFALTGPSVDATGITWRDSRGAPIDRP